METRTAVLEKEHVSIPYYTWDVENPRAVVVFIHGLKSHSAWFVETGEDFARRGIKVYAFDRRGSGRSNFERGHIDSFRLWIDDIHSMMELAIQENRGQRAHLLGHCFGAKLSLAYALRENSIAESLILIAPPQLALKTDISTVNKLKVLTNMLLETKHVIPVPVLDDMFTHDPIKKEFIKNDALRLQYMTSSFCAEIFKLDRYINANLSRITIPLLILLADHDDVVDNGRIIKKLFPRLGSRRKSIDIYDCYHHLFFEPHRLQVIDRIIQWIS